MGPGRRWLAAALLCAVSAVAAELPDAPSTERTHPVADVAALHDLAAPPAFDVAEWVAQPMAAEAPPRRKKVFDKKFALLAGLAAGLTVADFELTQHCLQRRTCVEADPLMPTSHAGMYVTNLPPLNAVLFWWSYRRKEDGKRLWWLAPLLVAGSHAAGVGTNMRCVGK